MASIPTRSRLRPIPSANPRGRLIAIAATVSVAVLASLLIPSPVSTTCPSVARLTRGAAIQATAFPGVDLRAVVNDLPGLAAASGPYAGVATSLANGRTEAGVWVEERPRRRPAVDRPLLVAGTWPRDTGLVLERGLARRLGLRAGSRARVATTSGEASMRISGIALSSSPRRPGAAGVAYARPHDLRRISPDARVHGSTVMLRLDRGATPSAVGAWLARRFPGPELSVAQPASDMCLPAAF